ncbi:MAG: sigma 54-interacting transcriptional regulator [Sphingobacteriales bacterium]|nr:sigma 54-interacting transcriptional regulator [Sphingobacteriales bacterium]
MSQATNDIEKDILLSHFSLENLNEGVFWIRSNGQIFNVNQRACEMTGRSREELLQMKVPELNASAEVQDFTAFWKKLKQKRKFVFEAQHRHKDGHLYDVEISGNFIEHDGEELTCSIVRYLGKEKLEQQLLRTITEVTSGLTGINFLEKIAKSLSTLLQMQYATIAQCKEGDTTEVRTVCIASGETILDNVDYDTKGRPCELILQDKNVFVSRDVQKIFPEAKGIEASLGVPIHSSVTGKIIGHIIVSHTEPVSDDKNQTTILKIFASRVGAEIERMTAEKRLQQKNEELRNRIQESELYHYTLENLNEDVYWVDIDGNFIQVNQSACKTTGYSKDELLKMSVFDINPSESKNAWLTHWQEVKAEKSITLITQHKHKEGYLIDVEVTNNYIAFEGNEFFCSVVRDIRRKRMEEELLKVISEATAGLTGVDYFRELAKHVTSTLGVRYAIVTECANEEKTRVRSLSYVDRQELKENVEYDLAGTPCETVMKGKDYFCANELEKIFPREKGIQSYVAVPIYSQATGEVLGHIAGLDTEPMSPNQNQTSILKIFAARAGAEMDRLDALRRLEKANEELKRLLTESEERFRDLFEEAPIAYVHEGLDSKFIKANRAALKTLGVKPEEVLTMYGLSLIPDTPDAQRRAKEAFESIGRGTDTSGVVLELRRKDNGQPIYIQWWSNPDKSGQYTRTMFVDITDKVLMEQEQARLKAQNQYLQEEIKLNHNFEEIVSKSKSFHKVLQQIEQVAATDATVLIVGESGTGKELIARAVHNISNRNKRPLVKVNCATLPANLIESELFGHEKGAFTGALERKIGRFELADGGTIFLDEIGELPIELQAKLLRILQEGEFERLGNPKTFKVNVRVIAATNRNLQQAIEKKEFREDLYYRLNVFPVSTPPLRDRKEDIPLLVKHFIHKYEGRMGKKIKDVSPEVINALMYYQWPGNIRELENLIERALILTTGETLEYGDWLPMAKTTNGNGEATHATARTMEEVEKEHIISILKQSK